MNLLVFDIETIPDTQGARKIWDFGDLTDSEVALAMLTKRRQETKGASDFIRHHLQKVVAISVAIRNHEKFLVWSLGEEASSESDIIQRFFDGLDKYTPTLVSWNGSGFDLPVLHYRAMLNKVVCFRYWEDGTEEKSFRFDNYLSRYHRRHLDLMDVLAGYQPRAFASLDDIASLMALPGKTGISGSDVYGRYASGDIAGIRNYCETDVLNTWLVYLRFELMRGRIDQNRFEKEVGVTKSFLETSEKNHFYEFLTEWNSN